MLSGYLLADQLIQIIGERSKRYKNKFFSFFLTLQSLQQLAEKLKVTLTLLKL